MSRTAAPRAIKMLLQMNDGFAYDDLASSSIEFGKKSHYLERRLAGLEALTMRRARNSPNCRSNAGGLSHQFCDIADSGQSNDTDGTHTECCVQSVTERNS